MSFPKDQQTIEFIKSATIAIGLMDLDTNLISIGGSGFIYDHRGYIMTAAHVLNPCVNLEKSLQQKGKNVETVALLSIVSEKNNKAFHFEW